MNDDNSITEEIYRQLLDNLKQTKHNSSTICFVHLVAFKKEKHPPSIEDEF